MRTVLVGGVLLSVISVIWCSTEPCSMPTDEADCIASDNMCSVATDDQLYCIEQKFKHSPDAQMHCKGVDVDDLWDDRDIKLTQ